MLYIFFSSLGIFAIVTMRTKSDKKYGSVVSYVVPPTNATARSCFDLKKKMADLGTYNEMI